MAGTDICDEQTSVWSEGTDCYLVYWRRFLCVCVCGKVPTSRSPRPWDLVSALPLCDSGWFRSLRVSTGGCSGSDAEHFKD